MRQTGIYPECTTASVQPHLTSAVKVACGSPGNQETPQPSAAGVTNACEVVHNKRAKEAEDVENLCVSIRCASQMRRIHSCTLILPQRMSKTLLPLCSSASLFRPYRAPRTHLQIKKHPLLFAGRILCALVFVRLPRGQTEESHSPNLQENLTSAL